MGEGTDALWPVACMVSMRGGRLLCDAGRIPPLPLRNARRSPECCSSSSSSTTVIALFFWNKFDRDCIERRRKDARRLVPLQLAVVAADATELASSFAVLNDVLDPLLWEPSSVVLLPLS